MLYFNSSLVMNVNASENISYNTCKLFSCHIVFVSVHIEIYTFVDSFHSNSTDGLLITMVCILISLIAPLQLSSNVKFINRYIYGYTVQLFIHLLVQNSTSNIIIRTMLTTAKDHKNVILWYVRWSCEAVCIKNISVITLLRHSLVTLYIWQSIYL